MEKHENDRHDLKKRIEDQRNSMKNGRSTQNTNSSEDLGGLNSKLGLKEKVINKIQSNIRWMNTLDGGLCRETGKKIPLARLYAAPASDVSIEGKEIRERRKRKHHLYQ